MQHGQTFFHWVDEAGRALGTITRLLVDLLAEAAKQHGLTELVLSGGGSANQTTRAGCGRRYPASAC